MFEIDIDLKVLNIQSAKVFYMSEFNLWLVIVCFSEPENPELIG